jgi:hypothetical protein
VLHYLFRILVLVLLYGAGPVAMAQETGWSQSEISRALSQSRSAHDLQGDLPGLESPAPAPEQSRGEKQEEPDALPPWLNALLSNLLPILFWTVIAGVVLALLWAIVRELPVVAAWLEKRRAVTSAPSEQGTYDARPEPQMARGLLQQADELAARGDFAAAVRLLLQRTLEDVAERLGQYLPAAWTSREVVERSALEPESRRAFDDIVDAVETSHFGGYPFGAEDYARCRRSYERFAGLAA